ncbi:unnamed protein product [Cladocopium goreaui]|uniref:SPRY domain-containing SOCS box protein 1 n=1 Tax=Cladocopium goreaui TaxID=2562237 RepID=A0A9P1M0Q9_9DINO|nr:unnamed protein product [Cladocopium goreaui]
MSEEPGTEVKILAPSGHCLQTLQLPIQAPAAETMRTSLRAAGKEAKGIFVFTVGTTILEEEWPLEKLGITEGSSIEVTVLDSMRPCFEWAVYDASFGNEILDNGSTFQRGQVASHTDGVRTAVPLPRDTECYICFKGINTGTHASVGVGTSNCEVAERGYVHLYGQDENSWALCFGDSGEIVACHKGEVCVMQNSKGEQLEAPPRTNFPHMSHSHMSHSHMLYISFLISAAGQMRVTLAGYPEVVVPFEIPTDLDVFVMASTVYGKSQISISPMPFPPPTDPELPPAKSAEKPT